MSKVVRNKSNGYGYKYSSLADLAEEGVEIPKMRIKATEFGEYIEYFDGQDWQMGAKIVLIQSKQMNEAQAYGASLTYARRYTVQMAEMIACDDDDQVEAAKPEARKQSTTNGFTKQNKVNFAEVRAKLKTINTVSDLEDYWKSLGKLSDSQAKFLQNDFSRRKDEIIDGND